MLLINQYANVFVFGDFNIRQKDWLTYTGRNDRPGELCRNFYISHDLTQMVNFLIWIPDCEAHNTVLLDLFISSDASICSTMVFPQLWNSDHVVSISIDFLSNSKREACFIAHLMTIFEIIRAVFVITWEIFQGRISLNLALLLLVVNFVSGSRLELIYMSFTICLHLTKQNYLLKTSLSILILMHCVSLYLFSLLKLIWNCTIFL